MVGSLAVIADVPKTMVYELARHVNATDEVIPINILEKAPSAELIPNQADQDDLPPYPLLDQIAKAYIEENRSYDAIVSMGLDPSIVSETIARVDYNEYKRYQSPPALKVTSKSFGYGRRYPIARKYAWQDPATS
jgi:NH3-dependent NAD+ synthetase